MSKRYSVQFKEEVLKYGQQNPQIPAAQLCVQFGIGLSTLGKWQNKARTRVSQAQLDGLSPEQRRLFALEREVAHLREVNDILKKAHVYFVNNPAR